MMRREEPLLGEEEGGQGHRCMPLCSCDRGCWAACPQMTCSGRKRVRDWLPQVLYAIVALVDVLVLGTICVVSIVDESSDGVDDDNSAKAIAYAVVALYTLTAFGFFTLDAVFAENTFQLGASLATAVLIAAWTIISTAESRPGYGAVWGEWSLRLMITHCVCTVAYLALAFPVYRAFGWNAYRVLGTADSELLAYYERFYQFCSCLKIDFVVCVLLVLIGWLFIFGVADLRFWASIGAAVATLLVIILAWFGATRESKLCMWLFFCMSLLEPAFIVYELYVLAVGEASFAIKGSTFPTAATIGGIAIILRICLVYQGCKVCSNFGKGLKPWLVGRRAGRGRNQHRGRRHQDSLHGNDAM